jgi:transposase-like protein
MSKRVEKKKPKQARRSFTDEFKREAVALKAEKGPISDKGVLHIRDSLM